MFQVYLRLATSVFTSHPNIIGVLEVNVSTSIGCFLGRWVMDGLHARDHGSPSRSHSQLDQRSELKLETKK